LQTHKPIDSLTLNKKVMRYCKQDDQNKGQWLLTSCSTQFFIRGEVRKKRSLSKFKVFSDRKLVNNCKKRKQAIENV
jgi:hypothetical protein